MARRIMPPFLKFSLPQKILDSTLSAQHSRAPVTSVHILDDIGMSLVLHIHQLDGIISSPDNLCPRARDDEYQDDGCKAAIRDEDGFLFLAVPLRVPSLPVFPRGVHARVAWLIPPRSISGSVATRCGGLLVPPDIVEVVHAPFLWVTKDIVCDDDEPVTVELREVRDVILRAIVLKVRVVKLDQLEEPGLVVWRISRKPKDFVRSGICRRRPSQRIFRFPILSGGGLMN